MPFVKKTYWYAIVQDAQRSTFGLYWTDVNVVRSKILVLLQVQNCRYMFVRWEFGNVIPGLWAWPHYKVVINGVIICKDVLHVSEFEANALSTDGTGMIQLYWEFLKS